MFPASSSQAALPLTTLLLFVSAASAVNSVDREQFSHSFKLYDGNGKGGCDRNAPNGVPMQNHVLQDLDTAWDMTDTVIDDMPSYWISSAIRVRSLLKLFFGITFTADRRLNPDDDSQAIYNDVLGTQDVMLLMILWLKNLISRYIQKD